MRDSSLLPTLFVALAATTAQAGVIDTIPGDDSFVDTFNAPIVNAQTFVADDRNLDSFSFEFGDVSNDNMVVRGRVYRTVSGVPDGSPYWEAASTIAIGAFGSYTFDVGTLSLNPGVTYAVGYVVESLDRSTDQFGGYDPSGPSGLGTWFQNPTDGVDATPTANITVGYGYELSYEVVMNPEPGTLALFALGGLGLGLVVRRRRLTTDRVDSDAPSA